ncbi:MAG: hypothetical protein RL441_564 [Actinomycetota bacterium]
MSEEKNKTVPFLVTIIVILVGLLAFILGRASTGYGWFGHDGNMMNGQMGVQDDFDHQRRADDRHQMGGMMRGAGSGALSGADVMFLQMMIPHHQQAVDMSDLAIKTSKNASLLKIANAIKTAQTSEIAEMHKWLAENGASEDVALPPHHMHNMGMGGMLSDTEMSALAAATGAEFDRLWLEGMIAHHEGALHMVMMIDDSQNAEMAAFADRITTAQTAEITQMKALL